MDWYYFKYNKNELNYWENEVTQQLRQNTTIDVFIISDSTGINYSMNWLYNFLNSLDSVFILLYKQMAIKFSPQTGFQEHCYQQQFSTMPAAYSYTQAAPRGI